MHEALEGVVAATFDQPHTLLCAARAMRAEGHALVDTWSPFPIHGIDAVLEKKPSRLPWACLIFALTGAVSALLLQWWTSAVDYPLITGGKPLFSLPAFIPVTFELSVLFGALGVVFSFFVASRLRPRLTPPGPFAGVNDDRFILALRPALGSDRMAVLARLRELGAVEATGWGSDHLAPAEPWLEKKLTPTTLALLFAPSVLVLAIIPLLQRDFSRRQFDWDAGMLKPTAYGYDAANLVLPNGQTQQPPPAGTLARGHAFEPFGPGPENALLAGALVNPLPGTPAAHARGKQLFERICATCHGPQGLSGGPIIPKFPNPPNLQANHAKGLPDGQIYHIMTHGQGLMAGFGDVIAPIDRWAILHHLRELQQAPKSDATPVAATVASAPVSATASTPGSAP